jgi:hypothetical protein
MVFVTMDELTPRLRAVCDLDIAMVREEAGRHEYDGQIQDLSPDAVLRGLARIVPGPREADPHDEAHLAAAERAMRVSFGDLELHRSNPLFHLSAMDLACYDRDYAPAAQRQQACLAQLRGWPEAVDAAVAALDRVSAEVASALLPAAQGMADGIPADADETARARAVGAAERFATHLEHASRDSGAPTALGNGLAELMGAAEAIDVDTGRLAAQADAERDRLHSLLAESCAGIDPSRRPLDVARDLVRDHPDSDGVLDAARHWTQRAIEFTREHDLVPYHDGECLVGHAPPSRRWATAMMAATAPGEPECPSWYHITPPDPSWPPRQIEDWLEVFSATTLPAITVHEVAPGHFSHSRAMRHVRSPVRRILHSQAFAEGWAHYAEEVCVEEGFCGEDPRFAIGVWLEALVRVTRLACAIGMHTAGMSVAEAARRFEDDTALAGRAALAEAQRAGYDPTYGRYTWGKLLIMELRERARAEWKSGFSLPRFHRAVLGLGSPPLGLLPAAVDRG